MSGSAANLANVAYTFEIASVSAAAFMAIRSVWKKIDTRQESLERMTERLENRLERIESQFGPNGGGLREAVNNMSSTVSKIDTKVGKLGEDLSNLSGKFHQHIIEND